MPKKRRVLSPESAKNGRPHAVVLRHGGASALRGARLDKRSVEHRFVVEHAAELAQHMGGASELTAPLREVIEAAAEVRLLRKLAWGAVMREGVLDKWGAPSGAMSAYMSAVGRHVELMRLLGLERKQKPVPDLQDYLRQIATGEGEPAPEEGSA